MPAVTDATPFREVEVAQFRKDDFEDLKRWAEEMGISPDHLAEQILRQATNLLSRRGKGNNVVPFSPRR